jgi:hypothetical protein
MDEARVAANDAAKEVAKIQDPELRTKFEDLLAEIQNRRIRFTNSPDVSTLDKVGQALEKCESQAKQLQEAAERARSTFRWECNARPPVFLDSRPVTRVGFSAAIRPGAVAENHLRDAPTRRNRLVCTWRQVTADELDALDLGEYEMKVNNSTMNVDTYLPRADGPSTGSPTSARPSGCGAHS